MDVTDKRAIIAGGDLSWNAAAGSGIGAIVTYRFLAPADLPAVWDVDYRANSVHSFTADQQDGFRIAAGAFEATANLRFVETDGPAMIDIYAVRGSRWGGWANLAQSDPDWTGQGIFVIDASGVPDFTAPYAQDTLLHEIGHAVGLSHPHEGPFTLPDWLDDTRATIMSYNFTSSHGLRPLDRQALASIYGGPDGNRDWTVTGDASGWTIAGTGRDDRIVGAYGRNDMAGRGGDDLLAGREQSDTLAGGRGDDRLLGMAGADLLRGGPGADTLFGYAPGGRGWGDQDGNHLFGGRGGDRLVGDRMADRLYGNGGRDILRAGDGADRLTGGDGDDRLTGGAGADGFRFVRTDRGDRDVITDFELGIDDLLLGGLGVRLADATITPRGGGQSTLLTFDKVGFELLLAGIDPDAATAFWGV